MVLHSRLLYYHLLTFVAVSSYFLEQLTSLQVPCKEGVQRGQIH